MRRAGRRPILLVCALLAVPALAPAAARAQDPAGDPGSLTFVGRGTIENSIRQVVRTLDGTVWIAAVNDTAAGGISRLRMFRSTTPGIPSAFQEVDAADAPAAPGGFTSGASLGGGDARLDRDGAIHVVYFDQSQGTVVHRTFDTAGLQWGAAEVVADIAGSDHDPDLGGRGNVNTALAIEPDGAITVVATAPGLVGAWQRAADATTWRRTAIDQPPGARLLHPSLSADRAGRLHLAWLQLSAAGPAIRYARRGATGAWGIPETVPAASVLDNSTLDQGPSLAVDAGDRPVVIFLDADDLVRVRTRGATGWIVDDPQYDVYSHTPGVYLRGDTIFALLGHDADVHPAYLTRAAGATTWSDTRAFPPPPGTTSWQYDGSASARFDPTYDTDCTVVDAVAFDENSDVATGFVPDVFYVPIRLAGATSGDGSCREIVDGEPTPAPTPTPTPTPSPTPKPVCVDVAGIRICLPVR